MCVLSLVCRDLGKSGVNVFWIGDYRPAERGGGGMRSGCSAEEEEEGG